METTRIQNGQTERIEVIALDSVGVPVTGLDNVLLEIRRISDGFWLDFNDNTFKLSAWTTRQQVMTEIDAINDAGKYKHNFATTGFSDDTYQIRASSVGASNFPQFGELKVGGLVSKLLALGGENSKLFDTSYDLNGNLTSGTIRGFATKADLEADTGDHVFELTITGTYSGAGRATTHIRKDST